MSQPVVLQIHAPISAHSAKILTPCFNQQRRHNIASPWFSKAVLSNHPPLLPLANLRRFDVDQLARRQKAPTESEPARHDQNSPGTRSSPTSVIPQISNRKALLSAPPTNAARPNRRHCDRDMRRTARRFTRTPPRHRAGSEKFHAKKSVGKKESSLRKVGRERKNMGRKVILVGMMANLESKPSLFPSPQQHLSLTHVKQNGRPSSQNRPAASARHPRKNCASGKIPHDLPTINAT